MQHSFLRKKIAFILYCKMLMIISMGCVCDPVCYRYHIGQCLHTFSVRETASGGIGPVEVSGEK